MTSSHVYHHAKFRWTENLTCRFIQLRKEHGKMFTGRKYSAQVGWEYILRQMREEFPTIMADVHYRVLKKKWSNLLQQYKSCIQQPRPLQELKNPVHGDKNRADDISWPFYSAIEEVLGNLGLPASRHRVDELNIQENDDLNPQEFLYVSVTPDDDNDENASVDHLDIADYDSNERERVPGLPGLPRLQPLRQDHRWDPLPDSYSEKTTRRSTSSRKRRAPMDGVELLSRLPNSVELTMRPIRSTPRPRSGGTGAPSAELPELQPIAGVNGAPARNSETPRVPEEVFIEESEDELEDEAELRKRGRRAEGQDQDRESRLEKRIAEFFDYTKRRDEENRSILMRMLVAIEDIRNAVS